MGAACGVTLIKKMSYRGDANEEWSNQYWFTGSTPSDATAWKTLYDALILQEKTCYLGTAAVVRAYGYADDADGADSVNMYDYEAAAATVAGTASTGTGTYPAGDQAAWVRWKTSRLNTKGKPIFLRKYFHAVPTEEDSPTTADTVTSGWRTSALAFGQKLRDGTFTDGRTLVARGHSDTLTAHAASTYITTRTLKRRGKRPGS